MISLRTSAGMLLFAHACRKKFWLLKWSFRKLSQIRVYRLWL